MTAAYLKFFATVGTEVGCPGDTSAFKKIGAISIMQYSARSDFKDTTLRGGQPPCDTGPKGALRNCPGRSGCVS